MKIEIKSWINGSVLFSLETESLKLAVEAAVSCKANLVDANLGGANLRGANLRGADLWGANLGGANLVDANLVDANLVGANLGGANLVDANLVDANLVGANLVGANLFGEKLTKNPLQILGLKWPVLVTEKHIKIGCEVHKAEEWVKFKDSRIELMDSEALEFWKKNKGVIIGLWEGHK